ncbi:MAG: hypothetical protein ACE5KX_02165 [Acidimicrobiia bacterium]
MIDVEPARLLADLLRETGEAHHEAFIESDGVDPEWPLWYADHLHDRLPDLIGTGLTKSKLVWLLVEADRQRTADAPESDWPSYYADFFLEAARTGERTSPA